MSRTKWSGHFIVLRVRLRKALSSCFDCILLRKHPDEDKREIAFWCAGFNKELPYDIARTPNDCSRKRQNEEDLVIQFPRDEILARFYQTCKEFAEQLGHPFTMRELFDHVDYMNKNSLWELLEALVKNGKIDKQDGIVRTWGQAVYKVKTYWPTEWNDDSRRKTDNS